MVQWSPSLLDAQETLFEYRTSLVFKWSNRVRLSNGLVFQWWSELLFFLFLDKPWALRYFGNISHKPQVYTSQAYFSNV